MSEETELHRHIDSILSRLDQKMQSYRAVSPALKQNTLFLQNQQSLFSKFAMFPQPPVIFETLPAQNPRNAVTPPPRTHQKQSSDGFKPQLSKRSIKLASRLGPAKDRLLAAKEIQVQAPQEYSHHPQVNKRSENLDKQIRSPDMARWNNLYNLHAKQAQKLQKLQEEREIVNLATSQCTFKPQTLQVPIKSKIPTIQRLHNWAKNKEEKIQMKKSSEANKDLEGCTFTPQLVSGPGRVQSQDALVYSQKGVMKFLERQESARRAKMEYVEPTESSYPQRDLSYQEFEDAKALLHEELINILQDINSCFS